MPGEIKLLVGLLSEAYKADSWHGPNLASSVRRVNREEASWRPAEDQRTIWEITLHAAYWKYVVWRTLTGGKRGRFPRKGSNWFTRPLPNSSESWPEDVKLLDELHQKLRQAVEALSPADLEIAPGDSRLTHGEIIRGVALHDVYHAGQIQTLRQLYARRSTVSLPGGKGAISSG